MYYTLGPSFVEFGEYELGTMVFSGLVFAMQLKVAFLHNQWNIINILAMIISVGGTLAYFILLDQISLWLTYGVYWGTGKWLFWRGGGNAALYWFFGIFFVPLACALVDYAAYYFYFMFNPSDEMIMREHDHKEIYYSIADAQTTDAQGASVTQTASTKYVKTETVDSYPDKVELVGQFSSGGGNNVPPIRTSTRGKQPINNEFFPIAGNV